MESRGYSEGGMRLHSCCPRAGHYATGLAHHDLVAARRRLSRASTALASYCTRACPWPSRLRPASTTHWHGRSR
jgi:hypothetical protein